MRFALPELLNVLAGGSRSLARVRMKIMKASPLAAALLLSVSTGLFSAAALAGLDALAHRDDLNAADRKKVASVLKRPAGFGKAESFELMSGGAATSRASPTRDAFSHSSANLSFERERDFKLGNGLFRKLWVSSPSSTQASDGLGPLFNARSCQRCHLKDGRGHAPTPDGKATTFLMRLSVPPQSDADRKALEARRALFILEPVYGGQLQDVAVPGLAAEGRIRVRYEEIPIALAGGETASLRRPSYEIEALGYGPMHPDVMMSPRVATPMIGLGLLDAIHEGDILANADPDDRDGDGISGRPNMVLDEMSGVIVAGRYGWKATQPTIAQQSAHAFSGDIGISTPPMPSPWGDCTAAQTDCLAMPNGVQSRLGAEEAPKTVTDLVDFYAANLAVPARRDVDDPQILRGKAMFYDSGCATCHRPKYVTSRKARQPEHRFQLIWPYTDLLLHDMGEGLADNRPAGDAGGREWRTAPLWGIGLTQTVSGHTEFLHDGRARNLLEAILWHGGEAETAKMEVIDMQPDERAALLRFLESL